MRIAVCILLSLAACERSSSSSPEKPDDPGADSPVEIKTIPVADGIYMLEGKGGNIGVSVGDDGVLIIDDQFEDMSGAIKAAIAKLSSSPMVYVLNTHYHADHTGGNVVFGKEATIVAHENARKHLVAFDQPAAALPVITYGDHMSIHFNGEEIRLVHLPGGHTDGDTAVFFTKSNVVHLGDNFFNKRLPFIDLGHGGDPKKLIESTNKLLAELPSDIAIIPGHGPLATMADYKAFRDLVVDALATVEKARAAGKTAAQVKKAGFGGKYKELETSFIDEGKFAEILYNSL
jgi:glyoxylase-like metal-dependent hydrolase (beta-lactamase superfamily II)